MAESSNDVAIVANVGAKEASFALSSPDSGLLIDTHRSYPSSAHSTFTDALIRFTQDLSVGLDHRHLIMCVAGAVHSDTIRVTNGRWFISTSGLEAMLKRRPTILNDVSAVAWSTLALKPGDLRAVDSLAPRIEAGSARRAVIWVGDGLGAAFIGLDASGHAYVLDGEAGHMTCPFSSSDEKALMAPIADKLGHISYEKALAHIKNEVLGRAYPGGVRKTSEGMAAGLLGCFAGSVALAFGAWDGIFLAGPAVSSIMRGQANQAFRNRFEAKGRFRGSLSKVPVWTVDRPDLHLLGAAALASARGINSRA